MGDRLLKTVDKIEIQLQILQKLLIQKMARSQLLKTISQK